MKYTAVLLYPEYAAGEYGDSYIETAEAETPAQAAAAVQKMASKANRGEIPADEFIVVAVFQGEPILELNSAD